jgi:hypothetical protein
MEISRDGGKTWTQSTAPTGLAYSSVTVSSDGQTVVASVRDGGMVRSTDGGATWLTLGAVSDRYTDVALLDGGVLMSLDSQRLRDLSVLTLSGQVKAGDVIAIWLDGLPRVQYRVVDADLKQGRTTLSEDKALANVALKLSEQFNRLPASPVQVTANGSALVFAAKAGSEGFAGIQVGVRSAGLKITSTQEAGVKQAQTDALWLDGSYAVGDVITLKGIAKADVVYTVVANDLKVDGKNDGAKASATQILSNITAKLLKVIEAADAAKVTASGSAGLIILKAKTLNTALTLVASETSTKGSLRQTRSDMLPGLSGNVRLAESAATTWSDQGTYSNIGSANWSAVSAFDGGQLAVVASSAVSISGTPGRLYVVELASTDSGDAATHWTDITRNIEATRYALDLAEVEVRDFAADETLTADDLLAKSTLPLAIVP